jgi:hypothetical protein
LHQPLGAQDSQLRRSVSEMFAANLFATDLLSAHATRRRVSRRARVVWAIDNGFDF